MGQTSNGGKFVSEHFTPLTLNLQTGVVSTEDTEEIWETVKEEATEKVRGRANKSAWTDSPMKDESEVLFSGHVEGGEEV
jgi:hypothetical protein